MVTRLLIATTVPETLAVILRDQPRFLSQHFDVALVTSPCSELCTLAHEGVPVHAVPMQRGISPIRDFVSVCRMVSLMLKLRPDIVHSYTPKAGLVCMLAAWVCRVPVRVHTFTGLIWPTAKGWRRGLLMAVDRLLCACATQVVPEGLGVQRDLEIGRITAKPMQPIGNGNIAGVDVDLFSPEAEGLAEAGTHLRQSCGIQSGEFVYVYVGRLNRDKGLDELIGAFEGLPENCRLLIVGEVDKTAPLKDETMRNVQAHRRVHWLGFQHDIRPALMVADVLVLPSYREGFPNVVLQAGAMALPVIATDISGCNEVIEPGLNGWLVPAGNALRLQQAMKTAFEATPEVLHTKGQAARARVIERFERQGHWSRMVAFYRSVWVEEETFSTASRVLVVAGLAESLLSFRGDLLRSFQSMGMQVHIAAPGLSAGGDLYQQLVAQGWKVHNIPLKRTGRNGVADFWSVWCLWRLMNHVRPDCVLPYTIKPVIYGVFAAWLAGVPRRFALITGLGYTFTGDGDRGKIAWLVRHMYAMALQRTQKVFFHNQDDEAFFRGLGILPSTQASCVLNGSGVDLSQYVSTPVPKGPHFLLIARLLGDKGVREYAQAAQRTRALYPQAQFSLVGWIDENPNAIAQSELDAWVQAGTLNYLGRLSDVRPALASCSVFVLPSYREGTPRTVLEAMAMGRAVITTDAPGCRETVVDGDNGFLVPVKSVDALVEAMTRFITDPELATLMGQRGRQLAEDKYDVHKVNAVMLKEMGLA